MKKKAYIIVFILAIMACSQNRKSNIEGIWVKSDDDIFETSYLLSFDGSRCNGFFIDPSFYNLVKDTFTSSWEIVGDSLFFYYSSNEKEGYLIKSITGKELVLENSNNSMNSFITFYPVSKSNNRINLESFVSDNSFVLNINNQIYNYDFISSDKCINHFDTVGLQLEFWDIVSISDETFLLMKNPISSVILHLSDVKEDSLIFEYAQNGIKECILARSERNDITKEELQFCWSYFPKEKTDQLPPPHLVDSLKDKYVHGFSFQFNNDSSYVFKSGFINKSGKWKLCPGKKYILLDSIKSNSDIIKILKLDSTRLSILTNNEIFEQSIYNLYKN